MAVVAIDKSMQLDSIYFVEVEIRMQDGAIKKDNQPFSVNNKDVFISRMERKHLSSKSKIKGISIKKLFFLSNII